ncbi:Carboxylesterase A precursor [Streptomyces sp. YIM 130001]|uniref:alpha/beta hydrolase n=1 Tax=Streptomyces sp. YIM 130001 TaxID=2259644 RepID=UPI000E64BD42|nr:alpha/beta hydrolase [Streptomyces sp. YIM 130001]RII22162.1 Carboxylesterase A precursor [Streptomyces sp. YIM 130001]
MRIRSAIAGAAALGLLAAGAPGLAAAEDDPGPARFYQQKIKWGACDLPNAPKDMRCGTVTVPLDYAAPDKGTVKLAVGRIPASTKPKGSVLVNFGGPGGPGVSGIADLAKPLGDLTDTYDVVGFDPRGVGQSSPVTCGDGEGLPEPTENGVRAEIAYLRKAYEQCKKLSGPVLEHMGTVNVSRDMDIMRAALGDKKLTYLGFSYGTRLGAVYAAQFPKKVHRMALDGVDTLVEPLAEQGLISAEGQQTALDDFITWCTGNAGCVLGDDARTAREGMDELVRGLDDKPLETADGLQFSGDDLVNSIGAALYQRALWPYLSQALGALGSDGDPMPLLRLTGSVPTGQGQGQGQGLGHPAGRTPAPRLAPGKIPSDNETTALVAVNCADDPDRPSVAQLEAEEKSGKLLKEYTAASPVFGPSRLQSVISCAGLPKGTDFIRKIHNVDTPKIVLVGTRGDPATPYRWTEETAGRLGGSAVVIDNRGEGHTGYMSSKCVHQKVDDYLMYGNVPRTGASCGADEESDS